MCQRASEGVTPLHFAAGAGHTETVASLLAAGAQIDLPAENDWTALHYAAAWGRRTVAKILLAAGADPSARTVHGHTPMDVAVRYGRGNVIDLFRDRQSQAG